MCIDVPLDKSNHAAIKFISRIYREKWQLIENADYCAIKGHLRTMHFATRQNHRGCRPKRPKKFKLVV